MGKFERGSVSECLSSKVKQYDSLCNYVFKRFNKKRLDSLSDDDVLELFKLITEKVLKAEELRSKYSDSVSDDHGYALMEAIAHSLDDGDSI